MPPDEVHAEKCWPVGIQCRNIEMAAQRRQDKTIPFMLVFSPNKVKVY
jgi:hypothetical protein